MYNAEWFNNFVNNFWSSHEWRSPLLIGFLLLKGCYGIINVKGRKSKCIRNTNTITHRLSTESSFLMGRSLKRAQNSASSTFEFDDQNSEQNLRPFQLEDPQIYLRYVLKFWKHIFNHVLKCLIASSFTWKRLTGFWSPPSSQILAPTFCWEYFT